MSLQPPEPTLLSERIGLLTLPLHTNYGGMLQAVALYRFIGTDLGKQVVFLERASAPTAATPLHRGTVRFLAKLPFLPALRQRLADAAQGRGTLARLLPRGLAGKLVGKADGGLRLQRSLGHQAFLKPLLPVRSGPLTSTQDMGAAIQRLGVDALVVGSDQVWRLHYLPRGAEEDFFFGFAPSPAIRKIAYAASFGHGEWAYPDRTSRTKELLAQFDAVAVREASGVRICAQTFDRPDAVHVLDPTLLVDPAFYEQIAARTSPKTGKTLLSYVLDEDPSRVAFDREVLLALGPDHTRRSLTLDAGARTLDVSEWLRAFIDADFIVTDSFHGMVFAVIFRKNFIAIVNHDRGADRFTSMLEQLGLTDRLVFDAALSSAQALVRQPIDYAALEPRLDGLRQHSADFLRRALG
jgi:hypothetical protein